VTVLCHRYGVSAAGFYAWRRRQASAHAEQDRILSTTITALFTAHAQRYGSPRLHELLRRAGWRVSRRRVARLMRAAGLRAKAVCGYRPKARLNRRYAQHPNRLWTTTVTRPNQVWLGDLTYLRVDRRWRYLAVVMDAYSRRVLAWSLTQRRTARVACAVLTRAARARATTTGVIFHSDRGSEYMGAPFCAHAARLGVLQSASVRGPGDNAHMESFFHSLKAELTRGVVFSTDHALRGALRRYIRYYNTTPLHSALGYRSPIAFECHAA